MVWTPETAKARLDIVLHKQRMDFYKPIQVAETLRRARKEGDINPAELETYRNLSLRWRNDVTRQLTGKISTSSARFQHDIWNETAIPPALLAVLDAENQETSGTVERYIYLLYAAKQGSVGEIIAAVDAAAPATFDLNALLALFQQRTGLTSSMDKAYEIVAYSLFETLVTGLEATVSVRVPARQKEMLAEFAGLTRVLLGVDSTQTEWEQPAHVYRAGVTNAADRGLDMWANFGPAVQVKHLTLSEQMAGSIVDQVESDHIVIVCRDADAVVLQIILRQIGWGRRVRGVVRESELVAWYEKCLRGKFAPTLAQPLLRRLADGFAAEFPQSTTLVAFLEERGYMMLDPPPLWRTEADKAVSA